MTTAMVNWYSVVLVGAALLGGLLHGWQYEMLTRRETVANIILSGVGALITPLIMDFPSKLGLPETFALMFVLSYFISPNVVSLLKTFLDKKFGPLIATPKAPLVVLPLLLLAGCATVQGDIAKVKADLAAFTDGDLDTAVAMATRATDAEAPYRARCYTTLKKYVPASAPQPGLAPRGVVSTFERLAELDQSARGGASIPQDVRADCAVILISTEEFVARMGVKFAPVPGLGAAGSVLSR